MRIWGYLMKHHKRLQESVFITDCERVDECADACISFFCEQMDVPRPVVLYKHYQELEQFGFTKFIPDDFVERVDFDLFRMEILVEKQKSTFR